MRGKPAEQPGRGDGRDRAHEARPDRRPERRKQEAVAGQVVPRIPVVVPDQKSVGREQIRPKRLGREVCTRWLEDQVEEGDQCGRDHPEGDDLPVSRPSAAGVLDPDLLALELCPLQPLERLLGVTGVQLDE